MKLVLTAEEVEKAIAFYVKSCLVIKGYLVEGVECDGVIEAKVDAEVCNVLLRKWDGENDLIPNCSCCILANCPALPLA